MKTKNWLFLGAFTCLILAGVTYYSSSSISANEEAKTANTEKTVNTENTKTTTEKTAISNSIELPGTDILTTESINGEDEVATSTAGSVRALLPQYSDTHNINYDENSSTPMFRDLDIPETATNTKTVSSEAELRAAVLDLNINYIYFSKDIAMTSSATGVKIPYAKKYMRVSGKNPVTGEIHTFKEYVQASNLWANMYVDNTTAQSEPTSYGFENVNIDGYNNYGPINVNDNSYYVNLTMTNVTYDGPQPYHNLNGTQDSHNWVGTIPFRKNGYEGQEFAEAHFINVYGNFELYHNGAHSIAWYGFGTQSRKYDGEFRFKANSKATIKSVGRSFFYFDNQRASMIVEDGAFVDITSGGGLVRQDGGVGLSQGHRSINNISVGKNATLKIERTKSSNAYDDAQATLHLEGNITVAEGGRLYMNNESDSNGSADEFIRSYNSAAAINLDKAKSVLFYNPKGKIIRGDVNGQEMKFYADVMSMNLWKTLPSSKFILTPDNHFSFPDRSNISFNSIVTRTAVENYTTSILAANPATIDSAALNFNQLKVISMGLIPDLQVNPIADNQSTITGVATDDATVVATYDDGEGEKKLTAVADVNGDYSITIPERADGTGAYIKPYTKVQMEVFYDYRSAPIQTVEVSDETAPTADPVITIIDKDTPIAQFPAADTMVTNIWDKALNTAHPDMTVDYGTIPKPDLTVMGPVVPKFQVTVTDEAKHSTMVEVPIFIKDTDTEISTNKKYALRGLDMEVENTLYPQTSADLIQLIKEKAEVGLWDVVAGAEMDLSNVTVDVSKMPNPANGEPALGTYQVTLSYGTGASAVTKVINVKVIPSEADLTISFVNEVGAKLHEPITITGKIGSKIDLTQDAEVQAALTDIKGRKYELTSAPTPENGIEVIQGGSEVTYQFGGILYFSSTPDEIDFGLKNAGSYGAVTADKPAFDKPLVVGDSRVTPGAWELAVKTVEVMTSQKDTSLKLPDALRYKSGSNESILRLDEPVVILAHKNAATGVYDVSEEEWEKKGDGFKMSLNANDYRENSEYRATLLFTLSNTP